MQPRTADIDGLPVRWLESGDGIPIVFVHGIPTSPALWRHVLPRVANARCLAFEMVGYGESIPAGRNRDISVAAQAGHLLDWLDHLGVGPAVLVGHDLGGGVVQIAAVRRPESCAGLLLTNAIGYDSWPIPAVKAMRAASSVVSRLPGAAMYPTLAPLILLGHDKLAVARESLPVHARPYARHGGGAGLARQLTALDVADTLAVQDRLPSLKVPARVVWGVADSFQKLRYGERFAADLGTTVRRIDGGRHFTPEDHPDVIAAELTELIRLVSGSA